MALELIMGQFEWGLAPGAWGTRQAGLTADPIPFFPNPRSYRGRSADPGGSLPPSRGDPGLVVVGIRMQG